MLSTIVGAAKLKLKGHFIGLMPLAENMPGSSATKPGDVVFAMNGKSIQVNNTDAEGRLILADALCYADTFKPELVVDIATLTGACIIALGGACQAVYSTSDPYWKLIRKVSQETGRLNYSALLIPLPSDLLTVFCPFLTRRGPSVEDASLQGLH